MRNSCASCCLHVPHLVTREAGPLSSASEGRGAVLVIACLTCRGLIVGPWGLRKEEKGRERGRCRGGQDVEARARDWSSQRLPFNAVHSSTSLLPTAEMLLTSPDELLALPEFLFAAIDGPPMILARSGSMRSLENVGRLKRAWRTELI